MFKDYFYILSNSRSKVKVGKKIWSFFLLSKTYKKNLSNFLTYFNFFLTEFKKKRQNALMKHNGGLESILIKVSIIVLNFRFVFNIKF